MRKFETQPKMKIRFFKIASEILLPLFAFNVPFLCVSYKIL